MPTRPMHPNKKQARPIDPPAMPQRQPETTSMHQSTVQQMMQKLEKMENAGPDSSGSSTGHNRWMVPYADLLTVLLGLFLVLFTTAQKPEIGKAGTPSQQQSQTPAKTVATPLKTQTKTTQQQAKDLALAKQLQQKIGAKGIEIRQQERGVVISLKDSILFSPGKADLSPQAQHTLKGLTQQLQAALGGETRSIRVEGHTDNTPIATSKYPSNWELSTARATTIVRFLVSSHQFKPQHLSAAGYGEFKPVKDNSSIEGKQKNRRVDIVVLKPDLARQEPPSLSKTTNDPTAPKIGSNETFQEE